MSAASVGNKIDTKAPHVVIEEAFSKFKAKIHHSDARLFVDTKLEDVEKAALVISEDQASRKCSRNLRRLQPLFDILQKLGAAIEPLCQGVPYLCFVWVSMALLLGLEQLLTDIGSDQTITYGELGRSYWTT